MDKLYEIRRRIEAMIVQAYGVRIDVIEPSPYRQADISFELGGKRYEVFVQEITPEGACRVLQEAA